MNRFAITATFRMIFWAFIPLISVQAQEMPGAIQEGVNLFSPNGSTLTSLIDNDGNLIRSWESEYPPGLGIYLLENGRLLRPANSGSPFFLGGGGGGIIEEFDRNNQLTWFFQYDNSEHRLHHDVQALPNGNILMIAWERKTEVESIQAGRDPSRLGAGEVWGLHIIEVEPNRPVGGDIVWEWHVWDHLVQDFDAAQDNFGVVVDSPQLVDINFFGLRNHTNPDWNHTNAIHYNPELDQIMVSIHSFSEFWIIDHSTTTAEAAAHSGGLRDRGGDLLYRWGNPETYRRGTNADRKLFGQHDTRWIDAGLPGAGNILLFNNGNQRPGAFSEVLELVPPLNMDGTYTLDPGMAYGPEQPFWFYQAPIPSDFFSEIISGAQRLQNGNTLICEGTSGHFFEVTDGGDVVWDFLEGGFIFRVNRYSSDLFFRAALPGWPNEENVLDLLDTF